MTRHGRQVSLASSYSPILIDPTASQPNVHATTSEVSHTPRLKYPYPLPLLALCDVAYTAWTYQRSTSVIPPHLLALCAVRATVLILGLGISIDWRSRGGWVGGGSVLSLGSVVWEGCKGQLLKRVDEGGPDTAFLVVTACLAINEFLAFMLLLRLSPPSHRQHPFSLRVPPSAYQSPTAFTYSSLSADLSSPTPQPSDSPSNPFLARAQAQAQAQSLFDDDFESDSVSSISESSIIDLPPPLEPSRLLPPSVSLNTGLSLAALDESPVIGPLVRRTRSARFSSIRNLGRVGSTNLDSGREVSDGYGTFGFSASGPVQQQDV